MVYSSSLTIRRKNGVACAIEPSSGPLYYPTFGKGNKTLSGLGPRHGGRDAFSDRVAGAINAPIS
ncbi:hypothetical protein [Spirosoma agri]|uniref:hypothetical protein n=1 Tax=Spirosoma agri TaxID=1987381 RepID=UPI001FE70B79|nr:hypothetical protein [Spirosoma agri]